MVGSQLTGKLGAPFEIELIEDQSNVAVGGSVDLSHWQTIDLYYD